MSKPSAQVTPAALRAQASSGAIVPVPTPRRQLAGALAIVLALATVLHGVGYQLGLSDQFQTIGLSLAGVVLLVALRVWWSRALWETLVLWLLGAAQAALFGLVLVEAPLPFALRPLLVVAVSIYLAVLILTAGLLQVSPHVERMVALAASVTVAALAIESGSSLLLLVRSAGDEEANPASSGLRYRGTVEEHPLLGPIPGPGTVSETIYPDDPRGYFGRRGDQWGLSVQPSSRADLRRADEGVVGVVVHRASDPTPWHIQLSHLGLAVAAQEEYVLSFRARATRERRYTVGVGMAHDPWDGLGLYQTLPLGSEWTQVARVFTASLSDDNARINFDLGGDSVDFYVADLTVRRSDQNLVLGGSQPEYFVATRWNSFGCRGPEYAVPAPAETFRTLVLGGSYTEGVGVHEDETLPALLREQLEQRADEADDPRVYEVVNCGMRGLAMQQQRIRYETQLRVYEPDLVLVVLSVDEGHAFPYGSARVLAREPTRWEQLLSVLQVISSLRDRPSVLNAKATMDEVVRLHDRLARRGIPLGLVAYRHSEDREWDRWLERGESTAATIGAPLLDLAPELSGYDWDSELAVHPLDRHPNDQANRIAARAILGWLGGEGLLPTPGASSP